MHQEVIAAALLLLLGAVAQRLHAVPDHRRYPDHTMLPGRLILDTRTSANEATVPKPSPNPHFVVRQLLIRPRAGKDLKFSSVPSLDERQGSSAEPLTETFSAKQLGTLLQSTVDRDGPQSPERTVPPDFFENVRGDQSTEGMRTSRIDMGLNPVFTSLDHSQDFAFLEDSNGARDSTALTTKAPNVFLSAQSQETDMRPTVLTSTQQSTSTSQNPTVPPTVTTNTTQTAEMANPSVTEWATSDEEHNSSTVESTPMASLKKESRDNSDNHPPVYYSSEQRKVKSEHDDSKLSKQQDLYYTPSFRRRKNFDNTATTNFVRTTLDAYPSGQTPNTPANYNPYTSLTGYNVGYYPNQYMFGMSTQLPPSWFSPSLYAIPNVAAFNYQMPNYGGQGYIPFAFFNSVPFNGGSYGQPFSFGGPQYPGYNNGQQFGGIGQQFPGYGQRAFGNGGFGQPFDLGETYGQQFGGNGLYNQQFGGYNQQFGSYGGFGQQFPNFNSLGTYPFQPDNNYSYEDSENDETYRRNRTRDRPRPEVATLNRYNAYGAGPVLKSFSDQTRGFGSIDTNGLVPIHPLAMGIPPMMGMTAVIAGPPVIATPVFNVGGPTQETRPPSRPVPQSPAGLHDGQPNFHPGMDSPRNQDAMTSNYPHIMQNEAFHSGMDNDPHPDPDSASHRGRGSGTDDGPPSETRMNERPPAGETGNRGGSNERVAGMRFRTVQRFLKRVNCGPNSKLPANDRMDTNDRGTTANPPKRTTPEKKGGTATNPTIKEHPSYGMGHFDPWATWRQQLRPTDTPRITRIDAISINDPRLRNFYREARSRTSHFGATPSTTKILGDTKAPAPPTQATNGAKKKRSKRKRPQARTRRPKLAKYSSFAILNGGRYEDRPDPGTRGHLSPAPPLFYSQRQHGGPRHVRGHSGQGSQSEWEPLPNGIQFQGGAANGKRELVYDRKSFNRRDKHMAISVHHPYNAMRWAASHMD